jgi:ribose transport system substrate-binding protein
VAKPQGAPPGARKLNRYLFRAALTLSGVLAAGALATSAALLFGMSVRAPATETAAARYHFAIFLPEDRTSFSVALVAGARLAAAEAGAALTVHAADAAGTELDMAGYLGLDGAVVCPNLDDALTLKQLEKLRAGGLKLVLVSHNLPADQPWPFIGTNHFALGKKAGGLVEGDARRLAVVYSAKAPAIYAERELVEMGISGVLGNRLAAPIDSLRTDLNPRDGERAVHQLLRDRPDLTTLVFTDAEDTLAGAQAVIDLNLVGKVQVIGFGADPAIAEYVQKGIVSASLVVDPERLGFQAVRSLIELCDSGYTSTSVDIGITVLAREAKKP